ncbi:MAG: ATP-binding cassette domain-containing protein [Planctomycetes bacterium]|nr:ATP-binding cassette domain-containing protein [Planctomycetota bacterium]MBI3844217.1 ATP-binding cassette domain-containing protein [Planctomycetota bacterium]
MPPAESSSSAPVVSVRGLRVSYGDRLVLPGIDLDVARGEVLVILGPSGCGKSTLLKAMVGLLRPDAGEVLVNGRNVATMESNEYDRFVRSIGVLYQGGALFNSMTILENVALPLREHTSMDERTIVTIARIKLALVGLSKAETLLPSELSGGMRKRAGIARALALDPPLLFLDELSAGLDPIIAAGLDDLVVRLNHALACTMIVVSHELLSVFSIATRIAIMREGRLVALGTPDELRAATDPWISAFVARRHSRDAASQSWLEPFLVGPDK